MKTILFICTHNSARSQMGEGLVNHYYSSIRAVSAGTEQTRVNPMAITVMAELGIDISHHTSKTIDQFMDQQFDYVVTVCDRAKETCPYFPHAKHHYHQGFEDPSAATGSEQEKLEQFRKVRDQIKVWLFSQFEPEINIQDH